MLGLLATNVWSVAESAVKQTQCMEVTHSSVGPVKGNVFCNLTNISLLVTRHFLALDRYILGADGHDTWMTVRHVYRAKAHSSKWRKGVAETLVLEQNKQLMERHLLQHHSFHCPLQLCASCHWMASGCKGCWAWQSYQVSIPDLFPCLSIFVALLLATVSPPGKTAAPHDNVRSGT